MEVLMHSLGARPVHALDSHKLLQRSSGDGVPCDKRIEQQPLALFSYALYTVKLAHKRAAHMQAPVVGYGKPVRLVPYALQKVQRAIAPWQYNALLLIGQYYLLLALGKAYRRYKVQTLLVQHLKRYVKLRPAAVDNEQLRKGGEPAVLALRPFKPSCKGLLHRGKVIPVDLRLYSKAPVLLGRGL